VNNLAGADIAWKPLPAQELAMTCPAREVAYAGEKGAGKSEWLAACWFPLLTLAHKKWQETGRPQHRCRIIIFRKNMSHLEDLIAKTKFLYPLFDPAMGIAGWNINKSRWTFSSGATVEFHHLDGPNDHLGYHGQELVGIGFDQIEQTEEHVYRFIIANLRSGDSDYHANRMVRCTANPGGFDWIIPYFHIDQCPQGGKVFVDKITNSDGSVHEYTRCFIRAKLRDNKHLPADYEAQLRATLTEDEVAMFLEGDFFRVAGSYFSKFIRPKLHFQKSRPLPSSYEWRYGIDWGSTNPACWLLAARDNDGTVYIVDELHRPGISGRHFGELLARKFANQNWCEDKHFAVDEHWGVIDKQALDKDNGDATAGAGIMECGFRLFPAQKNREAGCNQLKERFLLNADGSPRLVVFEDRCPNLVRALSAIKSQAPKDPEDYEEHSPHSHAVDALRFVLMEMPVDTVSPKDPRDVEVERWLKYMRDSQRAKQPTDRYTTTTGYGD